MEMADHMAEDGFKEAGYQYVSIDVSSFSSEKIHVAKAKYKCILFKIEMIVSEESILCLSGSKEIMYASVNTTNSKRDYSLEYHHIICNGAATK